MRHLDFRKSPAVYTFLPLAAGILASYNLDFSLSKLPELYFIIFLIFVSILAVISYVFIKKIVSYQFLIYFLLVFIFGSVSMQYYYYKIDDNRIFRNAGKFKYANVVIYGSVADDPEIKEDRTRLLINVDSLSRGFDSFSFQGTVLASLYKIKFSKSEQKQYNTGDRVQLAGRLEQLPHAGNPGEFDYGEYLKMHDIEAVFSATGFENIKKTGEGDAGFFKLKVVTPVKSYINNVINTYSDGDEREFLRGLLLGDKSNISKETKSNFVNAGVAHIIAVSGLNVAYVLIVINALLLIVPIPKPVKNILIILSLLFYMELTGNSPSIVRATVMAIIFLAAQFFERKPNSYNTLAFAALVIVAADPRQLFDSGFILSFSAILSLIYFNPKLENIVRKNNWYAGLNREGKINKIFIGAVTIFIGTLAAQLGTLPVTAIMFKKVSVVSFAVNIFAIPISNLNLALGFVSVFISLISGWAAGIFAVANNLMMYYLLKAIAVCANFDFSYIETYRMDILFFAMFYSVVLLLFTITWKNFRPRIILICLLVCNFFVFKSVFSENKNAKISYLDAGNSNCSLIEMPGGTNILINTGTSSLNYTAAQRNLIPYLKREGINRIDLLIITAMDANELRNLKYLLNNFDVTKTILPQYYKPVFDYPVINKPFSGHGIEFIDSAGIINPKGNFRIYLYYDKQLENASMMAKFVYGNESFLFSDSEEQQDILYNNRFTYGDPGLTSMRVPLYGSFDFSPAEFIVRANPACIIISQKNRTKIIETEVFTEALEKMGFKVLNVANRGMVILESDGKRTKIVNW